MLTLPIKKKWFDMILAGEKLEEYRERTDYWAKRFEKAESLSTPKVHMIGNPICFRVRIRAGYRKDSPTAVLKVYRTVWFGKAEWGAEYGKMYNVLNILEVLEE